MKDPIFIDVGAHQGAYSIAFSKISKLVVAIEPNPENYALLKKNLAINRVKNCIPIRCALSNYDGTSYLYISELSDLHSLHQDRLNRVMYRIPVHAKKLDTLVLQELKLKKTDLVKIDVEGAEIEVLEGMKEVMKRYNPILVIEIFERNLEKVERILAKHNYDLIKRMYESIDPLTNEKYTYILAIKTNI
jgi:FkbM family methyltransferase